MFLKIDPILNTPDHLRSSDTPFGNWLNPVATYANLPSTSVLGDLIMTQNDGLVYQWNWVWWVLFWQSTPSPQLWQDYWWGITPITVQPVKVWNQPDWSTTTWDENGYQTMEKDWRAWNFVEYDFLPIYWHAEYLLPTPGYSLWLWWNEYLSYYTRPHFADRYTYLPFTLTIPANFFEWNWDIWFWRLYFYVNFALPKDFKDSDWNNVVFWINFNFANQQISCDSEIDWNWTANDWILLVSCDLKWDILPWTMAYHGRDDLTTVETDWWTPRKEPPIRQSMKIRWVLYRDTEKEDYQWSIIPLQIWVRYYIDRLWTKYPRSNDFY